MTRPRTGQRMRPMPVASGAAAVVFLGLLDDLFGLLRRRIAGNLFALAGFAGPAAAGDHRIGARAAAAAASASPPAGIFSVWPMRISPSSRPLACLMAAGADAGLLGDPGQRVAFLHLVGAGRAGRLGLAAVGGRRRRRGLAFLHLRRLRQHGDLVAWLLILVGGQVLAARGFRLGRLRIVVGSRDRRLVGIDIGRDDDLARRPSAHRIRISPLAFMMTSAGTPKRRDRL